MVRLDTPLSINPASVIAGAFRKKKKKDEPANVPEPQPVPKLEVDKPRVIRDQDTGEITFLQMPDGKTISGSDKELRALLEKKQKIAETPEGAVEASQIARVQQQQETIAGIGNLTPEQQLQVTGAVSNVNPINQAQAVVAGVAGASAGAAGGAAIGSIVPGVGTAIGAIGGAVFGFAGGYFSKITIEERQNVKNAYTLSNKAASNMEWVISEVNKGRMPSNVAVAQFNEDLVNFYIGQQRLKQQTDSNLKEFLSSGVDELTKLNEFESRIPQIQLNLALAIQNPNPQLGFSIPSVAPEE